MTANITKKIECPRIRFISINIKFRLALKRVFINVHIVANNEKGALRIIAMPTRIHLKVIDNLATDATKLTARRKTLFVKSLIYF